MLLFFEKGCAGLVCASEKSGVGPVEVYFDDFTVEHTKSPVIQSDEYYPFGYTLSSYRRENSVAQEYLYNGKEIQNELFLSVYDYGARMYDPSLGRWWSNDPLSELSRRMSPYTYCYNNPLLFVDPDGMFGEYYATDGTYLGSDGINDDKAYVVSDCLPSGGNCVDTQAELLPVKNSELMLLAKTSYGESSLANNPVEMAAISNAVVNNQKAHSEGTTLAQTIDGYALAASDGNARVKEFNNTSASDRNGTAMQDAVAGAINAVTGGTDYSNKATHWAGDDANSSAEKRATGGLLVKDPSHDIHTLGSKTIANAPVTTYWYDKDGNRMGTRGTYSYTWETTAGHGGKTPKGKTTGTTFMRKTDSFIGATGAPRY